MTSVISPENRLPVIDSAQPLANLEHSWPWEADAEQQPDWIDPVRTAGVRDDLTRLPGLVTCEEIRVLRMLLAEAAAGNYQVIQAGDCAEDPAECEPAAINRKVGMLDALAGVMKAATARPVIRIGRMAGQFAKPRSAEFETVDGVRLPVYRGHMVNDPHPSPRERQPDPLRMLTCYNAALQAMSCLRQRTSGWVPSTGAPVWTSHEALVLDYEAPLLRRTATGQTMLASTHLPWIGERTRQPDGAHVNLLAEVANPVACKIGPAIRTAELLELCARLDPHREPGRLTLIARMGAREAGTVLPGLVAAVKHAGHPVVWLCDPMHGNTMKTSGGIKTRSVRALVAEVRIFLDVVTAAGAVPAGLHLEATPNPVTECVWDQEPLPRSPDAVFTSLCDPRLNLAQAVEVAGAWSPVNPAPTPNRTNRPEGTLTPDIDSRPTRSTTDRKVQSMSETVIRVDDTISMINVFEVEPDKQEELARTMSGGADKAIRNRPGCISVNVLTSTDRKRVLYMAQWRSKADIKATMDDPDVQAVRDRASELAKSDPHAYRVYAVHNPDA